MIKEPQKLLWQADDSAFEPDLRIKFRLMLSWNDLEVENWEKRKTIELWRKRGQERFIERMKELSPERVEYYRFHKDYVYRGKAKRKLYEGERLKDYLFREPVLLLVRFWKSDETKFDIDNLQLKPIIDGMIDARLLPDDSVEFLPGVFRWYEGIDKTFALSKTELEARSRLRQRKNLRGKTIQLPPPPNKMIYMDFYRISRLIASGINFFALHG
jgi:hypothetical protein